MTSWDEIDDLSDGELIRRLVQRGYPEALARRCVEHRDDVDARRRTEARVRIVSVLSEGSGS